MKQMMILKICAVAVTSVILISLVRAYKPEFTMEAVLCASILLLTCIIGSLTHSASYLQDMYSRLAGSREYVPVILKALGIAYITDFTAALCQDAGEKSIAGKVELAGKIAIFFTAVPVFQSLLDLMDSLL